jgi:hypothetical protein
MRTWSIALFQVVIGAVVIGFGKMLVDLVSRMPIRSDW